MAVYQDGTTVRVGDSVRVARTEGSMQGMEGVIKEVNVYPDESRIEITAWPFHSESIGGTATFYNWRFDRLIKSDAELLFA